MVAALTQPEQERRMKNASFGFLAMAAAGMLACASSGSTPKASESSRDNVTSMEIQATSASTAYDLVNKLRPQWLRASGVSSIGGRATGPVILVYLDGNRIGTLEALRTLSAGGIQTMQFLSATRAAVVLTDIGTDAIAGAISIKTR